MQDALRAAVQGDAPDAGLHCEEEVSVTNSQITNSGQFLIRSKKTIAVDGSSEMEGMTYEFFKAAAGAVYQVYGSHTLTANLTAAENDAFLIPEGAALTIPTGITLENNGTMRIHDKFSLTGEGVLAGNGDFQFDVNEDLISIPEGLVYTGEDHADQITLEKTAVVCGAEFTADTEGWTRSIEPEVVKDAGEYTVTFSNDGKSVSKNFTVAQSGTDLESPGKVKTYNGNTETDTFTASDTITVKAAPAATGGVPQKAASRLLGAGAGQMALYVGDRLVSSEAADAGADGTYIMNVSASDVLKLGGVKPNGNAIPLTAKFVGNDNMAGAEGMVTVNISAVAKAEKDGAVIGYYDAGNLASAFDAGNTGATVTLMANVEQTSRININGGTFTLELNGKEILNQTGDSGGPSLIVSSGDLTIQDSATGGKITAAKSIGIYINGGVVYLNGGTVTGITGVQVSSGTLTVGGDTAIIGTVFYGMSITGGTVFLSGGTFESPDARNMIVPEGALKGLLSDGCAYFYDGELPVKQSDLEGEQFPSGDYKSVTVQECRHTGVPMQDQGSGKHGLTCPYCGYSCSHNTTLTAAAGGSTVTLDGGCAAESCGYSEELGSAVFTFPKVTYGQAGTVKCAWDGPAGYYGLIEIVNGSQSQFDKNADEDIAERSWTLTELFGRKVTADDHKMKVSFFSEAGVCSNECELDFTIDPAPLTPSITGVTTKTYDGGTNCDDTGLTIELEGLLSGDDGKVTATASYAYDTADAGENKTVIASGIALTGDGKDNYKLSGTTASAQVGTITKSTPTIGFASDYDPSKTYDGQTIPNPVADDLTIIGANFSDVGFTWSATPKDAGTYILTAAIPETTNTEAASDTLTITISPKTVTPAITLTPGSYEYTGNAIHPSGGRGQSNGRG